MGFRLSKVKIATWNIRCYWTGRFTTSLKGITYDVVIIIVVQASGLLGPLFERQVAGAAEAAAHLR
jgi:hypothetical protein